MKKTYGLLGFPLGHSFSKGFFTDKFQQESINSEYINFELPNLNELKSIIAQESNLAGFNITIPYKIDIIPMLDSISEEAAEIGAVNCVRIVNGRLYGYNTDAYGFKSSLLKLIKGARPNALILGTGGASRAVRYVLSSLGIEYQLVSRTLNDSNISYEMLNEAIIKRCKLIINTTPLGTFPNIDNAPNIPYNLLTEEHFLYDLVYNPEVTKFMQKGQEMGAQVTNGYDMLVGQALESWEIWNKQQ